MPQNCSGAWIDRQDDKHVGESFQFDEFFVTIRLQIDYIKVYRQGIMTIYTSVCRFWVVKALNRTSINLILPIIMRGHRAIRRSSAMAGAGPPPMLYFKMPEDDV
jgi:hypothetical protein